MTSAATLSASSLFTELVVYARTMKCFTGALIATLAVTTVEAYPQFFNGMTWANFAWEVNPKEQTVLQKDMVLVDAFDASKETIASVCVFLFV